MGKKILCIIPARSGSKGVPGKNVALVGGKPLIIWTIRAVKKSNMVDQIILSTDSEKYRLICQDYGIDSPFLRPIKFSDDQANSADVVKHALIWLKENKGYQPDYILYLQPTSPLRSTQDINESIKIALENNADSVVSVELANKHPYFMKRINQSGQINHYLDLKSPTPRRQDLEKLYVLNGAIFLVKTELILRGSWYGERSYSYIMPPERSLEIDTPFEMLVADLLLRNNN